MGFETVAVSAFFDDPVGDGLQLVKSRARTGVELQDVLLALPQVLHTREALKDKAHVAG